MNPCIPSSVWRPAPWRAPDAPPAGCGLALQASPQQGEAAALLREAWNPLAFLDGPEGVPLVFDDGDDTPWCTFLAHRRSDDGMLAACKAARFLRGPHGTALLSLPRGEALACIAHPDGWALVPIPLQQTSAPTEAAWGWIARQHPRVGTHPGQHVPIWGKMDTHPQVPNDPSTVLDLAVAAFEHLGVDTTPNRITLQAAHAQGWDRVSPAAIWSGLCTGPRTDLLHAVRWVSWVVLSALGDHTCRVVRQEPGRGGATAARMRLVVATYVPFSAHARLERRARWADTLRAHAQAWNAACPDLPLP